MKKLFIAGCSIATKNGMSTTYGDELAKLLDYECVHEGAGCGSNYRIWRTITNHIINGNLTSNDLLVINYTEPIREEFWSPFPIVNENMLNEDYYNDGKLIRFKVLANNYQKYKEEQQFFKLFEENFLNWEYQLDKFNVYHFNFQHMLKNHKIKTIFIKSNRIFAEWDGNIFDEFKPLYIDTTIDDKSTCISENDCHFSDYGHKLMAKNLYNHILKYKLNE